MKKKYNNFIFIFGCGHSGTTIMNKIIGNHVDVYGIPYETSMFFSSSKNKMLDMFNKERNKKNKIFVCEKTPKHVYHINEIYNCVNNPKIIVMVRNGKDTIASLLKRYGNFEMSVNRWVDDNLEWLNHKNRKDFLIVSYEEFVKDPQKTLQKICNYVGLQYHDGLLDYPKDEVECPDITDGLIDGDLHNMLRKHQINQPIYDGSNKYLNILSESELKQLDLNDKFKFVTEQINSML